MFPNIHGTIITTENERERKLSRCQMCKTPNHTASHSTDTRLIKFESLGPESGIKLLRDYVEQENLGVKARSRAELYERICEARLRRSSQGPVGARTPQGRGGGAYRDHIGVGEATMIKFESIGPESGIKLLRDYVEQENLGVKARSRAELYERICEARRSSQGRIGVGRATSSLRSDSDSDECESDCESECESDW